MSRLAATAICLLAFLFSIQFCTNTQEPSAPTSASPGTSMGAQIPFPDFGFMAPPDSVQGQVFKLSQNYPASLPTGPLPPFYSTDFQKDWRKYLLQVRDYCFEGNTEVDFRVENNKTRAWYHMPWQHYGLSGREGFHGLTKEAPVQPKQLAPTQTGANSGAWAVGFFNDVAGHTIGEVWKNHDKPDVTAMKGGFKNGAVLFKILFLSMPKVEAEAQIPFLRNGIWWDAYATYDFKSNQRTKIQVALIQMDIMVRDERAPNGWVFGNFQYNGAQNKANPWENLVPVGLMWGQDPTITANVSNPDPTKTVINPNLKETIINPDAAELPATHLGWNSRLNGPVDNPMSSCYSCHATAEFPQGSPISPLFNPDSAKVNPPGSPGWMRWFSNLPCGKPFDAGHNSTDFCLQMAEALQNFDDWKAKQDGLFATAYPEKGQPKPVLKAAPQSVAHGQKPIFALERRNQ
jgi:hypothetical protein